MTDPKLLTAEEIRNLAERSHILAITVVRSDGEPVPTEREVVDVTREERDDLCHTALAALVKLDAAKKYLCPQGHQLYVIKQGRGFWCEECDEAYQPMPGWYQGDKDWLKEGSKIRAERDTYAAACEKLQEAASEYLDHPHKSVNVEKLRSLLSQSPSDLGAGLLKDLERLRHTPRKEAVGIPEWIEIHNACTDRCDTLHGPCACGSQHDEQWLFLQIAEIVGKAQKWERTIELCGADDGVSDPGDLEPENLATAMDRAAKAARLREAFNILGLCGVWQSRQKDNPPRWYASYVDLDGIVTDTADFDTPWAALQAALQEKGN